MQNTTVVYRLLHVHIQICRSRGSHAPPPNFGLSVNPISTGEQIRPTTLILPPPDFQTSHGLVTHVRASLVDCARLKSVAKKYWTEKAWKLYSFYKRVKVVLKYIIRTLVLKYQLNSPTLSNSLEIFSGLKNKTFWDIVNVHGKPMRLHKISGPMVKSKLVLRHYLHTVNIS